MESIWNYVEEEVPDPIGENHEISNIFCFAALADKQRGTLYTDATGALPIRSMEGNQYFYVSYNYDANFIKATPISDLTDTTILATFKDDFAFYEEKGVQTSLQCDG